uniref:Uncharacterized protein n=1 Tax=Odontella aurita TaxID=265563 RepID=A0A7S4IJH9_9STRA|mmetsp:Transcript_26055/g.77144  ORF Transcript_26055/g.77144 Transcript_26055/m.77144 type:complete len:1157 (+) Transcript_26055:366-3836(+)
MSPKTTLALSLSLSAWAWVAAAAAAGGQRALDAVDLNSVCAGGGTFFPGRCGPLSSCHRCYYLGDRGQSCDEVCAAVAVDDGSSPPRSCDATGTSALGSLGDMDSCLAVADAMGLEWDPSGTYVGEPVGCTFLPNENNPGDVWVQRMVDATRPTSCGASDPGRARICSCEAVAAGSGEEAAPTTTLLSVDGGESCLDLDGDGECGAFALVEGRLVALPDAASCVGMVAEADDSAPAWTLVPCEDGRATRFQRAFDRYVSDVTGADTLDRFSERCAPLDLASIPGLARPVSERGGLGYDLAQYDQSDCASVEAGATCEVKCLNGYASADFLCPAGNVDRAQQPLASELPLCGTNRFLGGDPSLYGVPTSDSLRVRAVSALPGRLWVVVAEMSAGVLRTAAEVKGCQAPYCSACRIEGVPTENSFFHELDGCNLVQGASYRLHFYVSSDDDDDADGSIATYEFQVPTVTCPVAIEPERVVGGSLVPAGKQNGRFFWGSCYYVADARESCGAFCHDKLSSAACDVPGLLAVGSCARSADSCVQLTRAMGLPFDEKVGSYGDDSSGCTWLHETGGANSEFWVQRFVKDRDSSNPTTCDESNGDDSRHRICSCEVPDTFGEVKQKQLISIETGLLMQGLDTRSLQQNEAAIEALENVFLGLTGAADGDASAWIIDEAVSDEPSCESLLPKLDEVQNNRHLQNSLSKVWVYVGANSAGEANHIQLNIDVAVDSGDLVKGVSDALASTGISVKGVRVAGTTPEPTMSPTSPPTEQPSISLSPTPLPAIRVTSTLAPTDGPTEKPTVSSSPTATPTVDKQYKATGNFQQEFQFETLPLSQDEIAVIEEIVASLTPFYGAQEKSDFVETSATIVRQASIVGSDAVTRSRVLVAEGNLRLQYILNYVSSRFDVSDYPLKYVEFLSSEENREVLENRLILAGVRVASGSVSAPLFFNEQDATEDNDVGTGTGTSGNNTAAIVGAVVGVGCAACVVVAAIIYSRKKRQKNDVPIVHAVQVVDNQSEKSCEIVVEAFAVDDLIVAGDVESNLHNDEVERTVLSRETTNPPELAPGTDDPRNAAGVVQRATLHLSNASVAARREEVRSELLARKVERKLGPGKYVKKNMPTSVGASGDAAASRARQPLQHASAMPKGPEMFENVARQKPR